MISVTLPTEAGYNIFRGLNFCLSSGETAVIKGPTGAGKTFLAEMIVGLRRPNSGTVSIFGHNLAECSENQLRGIRRKVGGVGGIFDLIPFDSVAENLLYPLILRGDTREVKKSKLSLALAQANLRTRSSMAASELVRGDKMKVMLARATIADQPLLLIDEPLDRLDTTTAEEVMDTLKRISVSGYTMLILTTGQMRLDLTGAREYQIKDGRIE